MTNEEKLQAIRAKCVELLEIASKRTPGEWSVCVHRAHYTSYIVRGGEKQNQLAQFFNYQDKGYDVSSESNAQFIAACARNAEAGWRSTIAAIDLWQDKLITGRASEEDRISVYTILVAWEGLL